MADTQEHIGVYYFRTEGPPGQVNAYHAGIYYSYPSVRDGELVRNTVTLDAGPTIREQATEITNEERGILSAASPFGPIKGTLEVQLGNDNTTILPKGAIAAGAPAGERPIVLSPDFGKCSSTRARTSLPRVARVGSKS
jgi:hypothetical protein